MKSNYSLRQLAISLCIMGISLNALGQLPCGTDIMSQKLLAEHPELVQEQTKYEAYTQNYVKNLRAQKANAAVLHKASASAPVIYIIPVVFHVLEQNGPENISDAQIADEMKILNKDWAHQNPDTSDACSKHFKSIEGNIQVEFRLAKIDPNGNCTNGIERIYTNLTNQANDLSKVNQWDRTKYVNVWTVKSLGISSDLAGYAYWPWEVAASLAPYDGVIILSNYIGSIGTSSPLTSRCLTHELGHVMNLQHPWGATNMPGITGAFKTTPGLHCGDDGVDDTPETMGYNRYCPTDTNYAKFCDTVSHKPLYVVTENYQNFMEYSYCCMMFTKGQQERMWAALNSDMSGRNNLWDTANLIATGVYTPPAASCAPVANFNSNTCFVCQGSKVNFYDLSTNGTPTKWDWTFTGASVDSSHLQNPVITFNSLYTQTISLTVSNVSGGSSITQPGYVYVSPSGSSYVGTYSEGFENNTEVNGNWLFYNEFNDGANWHYTNASASTGTGSLMLNSYQYVVYNYEYNPPAVLVPAIGSGAVWCAITPSIDLGTTSAMAFSFDYSCATEATSPTDIIDTLEIDYSLNCGATWSHMKYIVGSGLANAGHHTESYVPSVPSDWQHISISVPTAVNYKHNVRFRFRYITGPYSNNVYIDNVNLNGTLGTIPVTSEEYHLLVYPNPMSTEAIISYYLPAIQSVNIGLYDITGRQLQELANDNEVAGQHTITLNNEGLSNGVYFIKMSVDNSTLVTKKLIVIK